MELGMRYRTASLLPPLFIKRTKMSAFLDKKSIKLIKYLQINRASAKKERIKAFHPCSLHATNTCYDPKRSCRKNAPCFRKLVKDASPPFATTSFEEKEKQ